MSSNINLDGLSEALEKELTIYSKNVTDNVKKQIKKSAQDLKKKTQATAPVGKRKSKHYKDSIAVKKVEETDRGITYQWYSKQPSLSHLLEKDHKTRHGGTAHGTGFIGKANDEVQQELEKAIEEIVKNG